ncbi:hypothetical protein ABEV34_16280 [Methylorubrum rhodesianum]|jgi:hypothetical protein|uniref:Uncharacterized protein n=1 Tax=Methylorubrum rhodesianum TaxID=29427 RepID=A0ABU9ZH40_9HYPH|nr:MULTISPECIES: hypothetical protein [Methylorubrum]MBB5761589.1 hypothetical protein [Methylorubrum rhodesianum]MBI1687472.1 hypothetical protein [Methylorubrum sp. DB1722]
MRSPSPLRRAALSALLGSLILSAPALAQSVANPNDQPTAGTLPSGTDTVRGNARTAERATGEVSLPSAIRSSTSVMPEGRSSGKTVRTNPSDHLSKPFRSSYEN